MKLFISSDIEGTCGITNWDETHAGGPLYGYFSAQMTREVVAAVEGALAAGYESTVKDAHNNARNLDPLALHPTARLVRGWERDVWFMMDGLNRDSFDAVAFTGYHAAAGDAGNPLSHTMDTCYNRVTLNGMAASEFVINAHMAAYLGLPIVFLSGDAAICRDARALVPGITTVVSKEGMGSAVISRHPTVVCEEIRAAMEAALTNPDKSGCYLPLPGHFVLDVEYTDWNTAHRNASFPGAVALDAKTVRFESDDYYEVMRFMHFCL